MTAIWQRRWRERWLLAMAAVALFAQAFVYRLADPHPAGALAPLGAALIVGLFLVAHVILVAVDHRGDPYLLPIACLLAGLATVEIHRLDPHLGRQQIGWLALGVAGMLGGMATLRDYRRLADLKYVLLAGALALQIGTMLLGTEVNGARLWIHLGGWSFQPVEIVKLLLVGFVAAYVTQNRAFLTMSVWGGEERALLLRYLVPLFVTGLVAELIFVVQKDMGQGLLFFGVVLTMFYAATRRHTLVGLGLIAFVGMSWVCYHLFGHVRVRFAAWLDPWQDAHGSGYQMVQALYALSSGGWTGTGLWRGQPWRIPEAQTDFIFVSMVEEMGIVVGGAVLVLVALLVVRAFRAARRVGDDFGALLACGIGAVLGCQSFIIVAGCIKMIPMTGITMPFMSYGGSSLLANFVMVGVLLQISHQAAGAPGSNALDRGLHLASIFYLLLLLSPVGWLIVFRLGPGRAIAANPDNPRLREDLRARGGIFDRRGEVLARSEGPVVPRWGHNTGPLPHLVSPPWDGTAASWTRRTISDASFGPLLGYRSLVLGSAGLERSQNEVLHGVVSPRSVLDALRLVAGGDLRGDDLVLTIDAALQRRAYEGLGGRRGAVILLDPRNGEILALASAPGFDPSVVEKQWPRLVHDAAAPLLDRALEGTYPPGSVLKPAVVALALDRGDVNERETFSCPGYLEVNGHRLYDFESGGHGAIDLEGAVTHSCNVALGQIGLRMGAEPFLAGLDACGLGTAPAPGLPAAAGNLPKAADVTPEALAQMAFGQGELTVSPLQIAAVVGGIANQGRIMAPHLIRATRRPSGAERATEPRLWKTPFSERSAAVVARMMESVVERGTGTAARIPGVRVAGKTGTAENPHGAAHAWFAAFAPAEAPRVVVVVLVENAGTGGSQAAPIARGLLEAALAAPAGGAAKE